MENNTNNEVKVADAETTNGPNKKILIYNITLGVIILLFIIASIYFLVAMNKDGDTTGIIPQAMNQNKATDPLSAYNANNFDAANSVLDAKLNLNNNDLDALLLKATTLAQEGSLTFKEKELGDEAMEYVNRALLIDPNSPEAYWIMGYILEIQQNYTDSYKAYDKAIELNPNYDNAYSQKGHAKQLEGNTKEAESLYIKALTINNDNVTANFGMAKILAQKGELSKAKDLFLRVVKLNANKRQIAESYYSAAIITEAEDPANLRKISEINDLAIKTDPTYAQSYVLKARMQFQAAILAKGLDEKKKLVIESYSQLQKAIEINKNLSIAHLQLAEQLNADKKIKEAKMVLNSLIETIPEDITLNLTEKNLMTETVKNLIKKI